MKISFLFCAFLLATLLVPAKIVQARGVDAMILNQLKICAESGEAGVKAAASNPVFRGLPVAGYFSADSGEGSVWGFVFRADEKAVSHAIPEAAKMKTYNLKRFAGPVHLGIRPHDAGGHGETILFCESKSERFND